MPNDNCDNNDVTTKSNPALTDDCEGQLALSPRAAAAEMARSLIVHVMESAVAVPINDYKALPVLALDDPDFPDELRGFGVVDGVPMLEWRQCPWNPDVLLAIVPYDEGVLVYHRWDGFGVSKDTPRAEQNRVGMMDLRLTLSGAWKMGLTQAEINDLAPSDVLYLNHIGHPVFSRAAILGRLFTDALGNQRQKYAGSDLLYAVSGKSGALRAPWRLMAKLFTQDNYDEVCTWGLSKHEQSVLDCYTEL